MCGLQVKTPSALRVFAKAWEGCIHCEMETCVNAYYIKVVNCLVVVHEGKDFQMVFGAWCVFRTLIDRGSVNLSPEAFFV